MKKHYDEVLGLLKTGAALSAKEIELRLKLPEHLQQKEVRNAIDYWRNRGEPIWYDGRIGAFWWSTNWPIQEGTGRWKRAVAR